MAIEISGKINAFQTTKTTPKTNIEGDKNVAVTPPEKNDSVALTTATQEITKAVGSSSATPVDMDKVNAIKKALAEGSYKIDAGQTAKKMVQFEKLMAQGN